jgi:hypothetical protein
MRSGITALVLIALCAGPLAASAALLGRLPKTPNGTDYQAAYDDVLNITWVTDASLVERGMWRDQVAWANDVEYLGFQGWRLASASVRAGTPIGATTESSVVDCATATELECRDHELGYMYRHNLGGTGNDVSGNQTVDGVMLSGIQYDYQSGTYLSGTEKLTDPIIFGHSFKYGYTGTICHSCPSQGWLVRDGDILARFRDVPQHFWAFKFIEKLAAGGITSGCGGRDYCPSAPVTRAQMAVFLERGMNGSDFVPPPASGNVFVDVPLGSFAANFIEQLYLDGITAGCGGNKYCPTATVTRAQMAVFLLRAKHGVGYSPPAATGLFNDVPLNYWAVHWIEQLAREGITAGCGGGNYCPEAAVTRDQMAVFLVRTFGL